MFGEGIFFSSAPSYIPFFRAETLSKKNRQLSYSFSLQQWMSAGIEHSRNQSANAVTSRCHKTPRASHDARAQLHILTATSKEWLSQSWKRWRDSYQNSLIVILWFESCCISRAFGKILSTVDSFVFICRSFKTVCFICKDALKATWCLSSKP